MKSLEIFWNVCFQYELDVYHGNKRSEFWPLLEGQFGSENMLIGNQTPSPDLSVSEKSCDGVTWCFALSSRLSELTFPKVLTPTHRFWLAMNLWRMGKPQMVCGLCLYHSRVLKVVNWQLLKSVVRWSLTLEDLLSPQLSTMLSGQKARTIYSVLLRAQGKK